VITGFGVTAAAASGGEAWERLTGGTAAEGTLAPDDEGEALRGIGLSAEFRPHPGIPRNVVHFLDRGSLLALDTALRALEAAGLGAGAGDARRFAVADGLPYRAPGQGAMFVPYGHLVARSLGVRGPVVSVAGGEASGMAAVVLATRMVERGEADVVIAGSAQALQRPLLAHLAGSSAGRALPFDREHAGMVPAEGAAFVVVEGEGHAQARGAPVLARIAGAAEIFDPATEPTVTPDATGAGRLQQAVLGAAGYLQNQVDLFVSCADGRPLVDVADGFGAMRTFGRHAYYADVTAPAGALGQMLAASGPAAVAMALEAMRRGEVWPVAGLVTPIEGLELAFVRERKRAKVDCVLVTALGTGGIGAAVLLAAG
jgi:3-oxoacyl-[acyl-carrier-protein] synthase II